MTLVDTPSFDDPEHSDMDTLNTIIEHIRSNALRIVAIIYLHCITDIRATGTARWHLDLLRALCGEHFYRNVVLVTTMWGCLPDISSELVRNREMELNNSAVFWADMLRHGSEYRRWSGSVDSANEIVKLCISKSKNDSSPPLQLRILEQLDQGTLLEETDAGSILTERLRKWEEQRRRELAQEHQAPDALQAQQGELEARLAAAESAVREDGRGKSRSLARRAWNRVLRLVRR